MAADGPSQRQLRVGEEVRHALAGVFERGELRDPALAVPITVTEVRMSPDLRQALVFIMPLGGVGVDDVLAALIRARLFLRRQVAHAVRLRSAPNLTFRVDSSFDRASHINDLLHSPDVARDLSTARVEQGSSGADDTHDTKDDGR
ncbi:MAG: 30S ribosome-binding factor RbfA [Rhodospirillales bacterium]